MRASYLTLAFISGGAAACGYPALPPVTGAIDAAADSAPPDVEPPSENCDDRGVARAVVKPTVGQLVITEVMPSPTAVADTSGEWFEVKVMSNVDLNGVGLDRVGDSNPMPDVIASTQCIRVITGSHIVFARTADPAMNGGLPAAAVLGVFRFSLIAGNAAAPGDVAVVAGSTVIDAVTWTRSTSGKSLQLDPDRTDSTSNDTEANFCDATVAAPTAPDLGTPGGPNSQCP